MFAQVCADHLGVEPDAVDVVTGDAEGLEKGWGTVASRSAVVAGNAVAEAAASSASKRCGRPSEAPRDRRGRPDHRRRTRSPPKSGREVDLGAVARAAREQGVPLVLDYYFEPSTVTWSNGAHAAVVAVDPETGVVELLRYVVVHDCGREINPMIVDGQIRGGVAQGIGGALLEEVVYDEEGQLVNGTLADYLLPTAEEVPVVGLERRGVAVAAQPAGDPRRGGRRRDRPAGGDRERGRGRARTARRDGQSAIVRTNAAHAAVRPLARRRRPRRLAVLRR